MIYEWTDADGDTGRLLDRETLINEGWFVRKDFEPVAGIEYQDGGERVAAVYLDAQQAEDLRDALTRLLDGLKEER